MTDLPALLRSLHPRLHLGVFVFCQLLPEQAAGDLPAIGGFREPEGTTVILPEADALAVGLVPAFRAAWITLEVNSDLAAVGLTAAVAGALAAAGIACNVMAAVSHDHLFVPADQGANALAVLETLRDRATGPA